MFDFRFAKYHLSDDSGSSLIHSVMTVFVLVFLGGSLTGTVNFEMRDTFNHLHSTQAFYLAEAGMQRALYEKTAGIWADTLSDGSYSVQIDGWGTDGIDNDNDGFIDELGEADYFDVVSTGTVSDQSVSLKSILMRGWPAHELYYHHAIYVGNTSGEPYTLELTGSGSEADEIIGDVFANGAVTVGGDSAVTTAENYVDTNSDGEWNDGEPFTDTNLNGYYDYGIEATGTITGVPGFPGGDTAIDPPRIWETNYEARADVNVTDEFSDPANIVYKTANAPNPAHNTTAETVVATNPAHIFSKGILNDLGPIDDLGPTTNENYYLWDAHQSIHGRDITVRTEHNEMLYFIDGNLWVEVSGISATLKTQTAGTRITIVVKGNIYLADELLYQNSVLDGLALIALTDGESYTDLGNGQYDEGELYDDLDSNDQWDVGEPYVDAADWQYTAGVDVLHDHGMDGIPNTSDTGEGNGLYDGNSENSGNIYLGDPNLGPVGNIYSFLYAQNDFVDYVLNDQEQPENFTVHGTMSAGNQVRINRARTFDGSQHTKMTVDFDERLRLGLIDLPALPEGSNRLIGGQEWGIISWHR